MFPPLGFGLFVNARRSSADHRRQPGLRRELPVAVAALGGKDSDAVSRQPRPEGGHRPHSSTQTALAHGAGPSERGRVPYHSPA